MIAAPDVDGFIRRIEFRPAYDKRPQWGIHNMEIEFGLIGPMGATTFTVQKTGWYAQSAREHIKKLLYEEILLPASSMWMASINYHSLVPQYEGQYSTDNCQWLGGRKCYCDGTGLAEDVMERFVREGEEVVWETLQKWYDDRLRDSGTGGEL